MAEEAGLTEGQTVGEGKGTGQCSQADQVTEGHAYQVRGGNGEVGAWVVLQLHTPIKAGCPSLSSPNIIFKAIGSIHRDAFGMCLVCSPSQNKFSHHIRAYHKQLPCVAHFPNQNTKPSEKFCG